MRHTKKTILFYLVTYALLLTLATLSALKK